MHIIKSMAVLLLTANTTFSFSQKVKTAKQQPKPGLVADSRTPVEKLTSFFYNLEYLCSRFEDNNFKQMLADPLKNNKVFLKEWEIGLNNPDAQIWHAVCPLTKSPYLIDSSNKVRLVCTVPFIKNDKQIPGSSGILQILPANMLDTKNEHDVIHAEPDAQSKAIGKVQPGEQYHYFPGTTGYSVSLKKYVADTYKEESDGGIGCYAIVLNNAQNKLGYISASATSLSQPVMQLAYIGGRWKIVKLAYSE